MVKYEKSIIYKLCCKNPEIKDEYIGSTTNFYRRKTAHKHRCILETCDHYNLFVYKFIRDNGDWENWDMVEVEKYNAIDKNDLHKRERYYIETLKPSLNKSTPTRTKKEWAEDNKERLAEKQKEYYKNNIEKIEKYREDNKEQHSKTKKEHYEKNKEKILESQKEYREKNKEKISEKTKEKIVCECGKEITKCNKSRHEKSKRHVEFLNKV
jgi:putative protein kinase ArgK-like GTPase of G3E family